MPVSTVNAPIETLVGPWVHVDAFVEFEDVQFASSPMHHPFGRWMSDPEHVNEPSKRARLVLVPEPSTAAPRQHPTWQWQGMADDHLHPNIKELENQRMFLEKLLPKNPKPLGVWVWCKERIPLSGADGSATHKLC